MRLTLADIARMAGVSSTTASRVLNGRGEVRPEVRERVERVIQETGYRPLASARALVSRRSEVVGLVLPLGAGEVLEDPYFIELIKSFGAATSARRLAGALFVFDDEHDQDALLDRVVGPRRVDGIIMSAYHVRDEVIERLAEFDVPLVTMGDNTVPERVGSVTVDNYAGGYAVGEHLAGLGRSRIGTVTGPMSSISGADRLRGFRAGLSAHGVTLEADLIREGAYTRESGSTRSGELMDLGADAIFVASDTMATGSLEAARARGLSVPGDVAIAGFDGLPSSEHARPTLTTVRQPIREVVDAALELLADQVDDPASPVRAETFPVELIVRESTAGRP
ncbi:LacI family DNA-binding transcriptional regulator [Demequina maris]|uniref:LacI family DNA-binding transcriptional regulator n=1 Tax=Demequina maris TaxID=1638982 RepID=UPI000781183B|nr:LacI family DNA-binding transcriptional regulator [Demequina maris]